MSEAAHSFWCIFNQLGRQLVRMDGRKNWAKRTLDKKRGISAGGADQGQREQRDEKELVQNQNGLIGMSTESTEEGCRDGRE